MTVIREATAGDLDAVVALFLRCWRQSYAGVLPSRVLEAFDGPRATELWRRALVTPGRETRGLVAQDGRRVTGVVRMGRDPDEPTVGHVFSLYVDPDAQGAGTGARLLGAAEAWLRSDGLAQATLWVFEANERARGFYGHQGWLPDGGARVEPEFGEPEVRLRRAL